MRLSQSNVAYDAQVPRLFVHPSHINPHTGSLGNVYKDTCPSTALVSWALKAI